MKGGSLDELDKRLFVNLSNPVQADIRDSTSVGLILDNDLPARLLVLGERR